MFANDRVHIYRQKPKPKNFSLSQTFGLVFQRFPTIKTSASISILTVSSRGAFRVDRIHAINFLLILEFCSRRMILNIVVQIIGARQRLAIARNLATDKRREHQRGKSENAEKNAFFAFDRFHF